MKSCEERTTNRPICNVTFVNDLKCLKTQNYCHFLMKLSLFNLFHSQYFKFHFFFSLTVVVQWIRPHTLNREVPVLNLLSATVVPLGKALYPHCLVPQKGLKAIGPLVACLLACFLSGHPTIHLYL